MPTSAWTVDMFDGGHASLLIYLGKDPFIIYCGELLSCITPPARHNDSLLGDCLRASCSIIHSFRLEYTYQLPTSFTNPFEEYVYRHDV